MALALVLLSLPFAGDVGLLASPSWPVRDSAHRRLDRAGILALPAVLAGLSSPDPEVEYRCARIAKRWCRRWEEAALAELLTGPGWCGERQAAAWVGWEEQIEAAARRRNLLTPNQWGPWCQCDLSRSDRVRALANWCRSQSRGGPLIWAWPWSDFVRPREK